MENQDQPLYPLTFTPYFSKTVWGGNSLARLYNKPVSTDLHVGEAWDVSGIGGGKSSIVANGSYAGLALDQLMKQRGPDILGQVGQHLPDPTQFPLLLKYIDARADLSIQVHPGHEHLHLFDNSVNPKSEVWVILKAEDDARIAYGLLPGVGKRELQEAIDQGTIETVIHYRRVLPGEVYPLEPGTVHAICRGVILLELQEPSDTTFRLYDYNRLGLDGKPRQLHVEDALQVIDFDQHGEMPGISSVQKMGDTPIPLYLGERLTLHSWYLEAPSPRICYDSVRIFAVIEGSVRIQSESPCPEIVLGIGDVAVLPAGITSAFIPGEPSILVCGALSQR